MARPGSSTSRNGRKTDVKNVLTVHDGKAANGTWSQKLALAAASSADKPLTEMQKTFVRYWAQGESIHSASVKAGYKDAAAAYLVARMPAALALFDAEKKAYEEAAQMTRKRVMDGLLDAAEMAKLMAEPASMVSAWKEIGRMCGYYEPVKVKVNHTINGQRQRMERMTDAELEELVGAPIPPEVLEAMGDDRED